MANPSRGIFSRNFDKQAVGRLHRSARRLRYVAFAFVLLAAIAVLLVWIQGRADGSIGTSVQVADADREQATGLEQPVPEHGAGSDDDSEPGLGERQDLVADGVFSRGEVIGNPNCILQVGRGDAYGIATALVPNGDGNSRYKVLDDSGTLFEGTLPFAANKASLGRSDSGSVLAGYGDLTLNFPRDRSIDAPEPVSFFLDGQLQYSAENAVDFGVAQDASAFFTIEPKADGSHVLKTQTLNPYSEREFDLDMPLRAGRDMEDVEYRGRGWFSSDHSDVMLLNGYYDGRPTKFYPVGNGDPVELWINNEDRPERVRIVNRHTAYYWNRDPPYGSPAFDDDRPIQSFRKVRIEWDNGVAKETTIWERRVDSGIFATLAFSDDQRYLIHHGDDNVVRVLNSETGELVFGYPTDVAIWKSTQFAGRNPKEITRSERKAYYGKESRKRLVSVEYADETSYPGNPHESRVIGNELVIQHFVQRGGSLDCRTVPATSLIDCEEKARALHGAKRIRMRSIFSLDGIRMESQATRRVPVHRGISCTGDAVAFGGLKFENGRFRYSPSSTY